MHEVRQASSGVQSALPDTTFANLICLRGKRWKAVKGGERRCGHGIPWLRERIPYHTRLYIPESRVQYWSAGPAVFPVLQIAKWNSLATMLRMYRSSIYVFVFAFARQLINYISRDEFSQHLLPSWCQLSPF